MSLKIELTPTDLVQQDGQQLALLKIENRGRPRACAVSYRIGGRRDSIRGRISHGHSTRWISFAAVDAPRSLSVEVDDQTARTRVQPPRPWAIHLVNHTHTDLGYMDYQPNIDRAFYEFLLEAMVIVDQTKGFPEPARFRWTIETAYHLQNFERFASRRQLRALVGHLRRGSIEATAGFLQMTDLPGTEQVLRSFDFISDFARRHRIPVNSGMACDVNGWPWVYPAALHDLGVHNLSVAINDYMARCPLHRPTPFWWESPDGKRVLVWHGEVYLLGNRFGIDKGVDESMAGVAEYLSDLARRGYPYGRVLLLMSGTPSDCAPPTIRPSLTARAWSRRFINPTLRLDTLSRWFQYVRRTWPDEIPAYRGHWPDYWAFGLGSAADEVRYAREAQHLASAVGIAASFLGATGQSARFAADSLTQIYDAAQLACEHTWGASSSVAQPQGDFAKMQWQYKRRHFYEARLESESAFTAVLGRIGHAALPDSLSVVVYNPLPWPRSGVAELECVQRPLSGYRIDRLTDAETGRAVPYWHERRQDPLDELRIPLKDVPATGYKVLAVVKDAPPKVLKWSVTRDPKDSLENRYYRVRVNPRTGQVRSIFDKQLRRELVRDHRGLSFGRIIHEQIPGPEPRAYSGHKQWREVLKRLDLQRSSATARALKRQELPGCFQQITFHGSCRGMTGLKTEVRLHEREKRIDFIWRLSLPEHPDPHAAYVAFPFAGASPRAWLEVPGAAMEPGVDQIPTTCYDFYTVQNFVRVETESAAVTLVPRDSPLVQVNEISTFRFREKLPRFNGVVVAWLFNNYWDTNFPASQPGEHLFRFSLSSGRKRTHDMAASYRFAYGVANPLRARFFPESPLQHTGVLPSLPPTRSFVRVEPENVILVGVGPARDQKGYLFRLQEVAGQRTRCVLVFPELEPRRAFVTDLYGCNARRVTSRNHRIRLILKPHELATVKVAF
ncbi:MAG TPA: glycoside hydrolase family 38 C-terminal domain-containing protein [Phycisphaerae bacterium]|nr:glycoside hydrolase family 38 C-terminal domain-containing protein [Phycisphaerae bacterium]